MSANTRRIASLFRELAEAFDSLDDEEPRPIPRAPRERNDAAAEDAARRVREQARRQGARVA